MAKPSRFKDLSYTLHVGVDSAAMVSRTEIIVEVDRVVGRVHSETVPGRYVDVVASPEFAKDVLAFQQARREMAAFDEEQRSKLTG